MKPAFLTVAVTLLAVVYVRAQGRGGQRGPEVGQKAPNVKLTALSDDKEFDMAGNFGKRPTILVFGSYT